MSLFNVVIWDAGAEMERGVPEACWSEGLASGRVKMKGARWIGQGFRKKGRKWGRDRIGQGRLQTVM